MDFGMKYNQKEGQICVRTDPTVPIAGPETFLEILEDFWCRQIAWSSLCGKEI